MRTYRHFNGRVWLAYDQAFRQHVAATGLTDWSSTNVELFNFHAAGASIRPGPTEPVLSRLKRRERHRPTLCAVREIEAAVRSSTLTADLLTAATSVLGRIVLRSARIASNRAPGAIANADLCLLFHLRRRLRPSVTEAAKSLFILNGPRDLGTVVLHS